MLKSDAPPLSILISSFQPIWDPVLESQILRPDLDIEALATNAIHDAINFVNEPLLTEVADDHREMLINAFHITYLRNLKAQKDLFDLFPAPPHPPNPEPNESIESNKSSYEPLEEVEQPDAFIGWSEADEASAHTPEPHQQPESIDTEPLPSLPRAALQRIEQAERLAKERYLPPRFVLLQYADDLLFAEPPLLHLRISFRRFFYCADLKILNFNWSKLPRAGQLLIQIFPAVAVLRLRRPLTNDSLPPII